MLKGSIFVEQCEMWCFYEPDLHGYRSTVDLIQNVFRCNLAQELWRTFRSFYSLLTDTFIHSNTFHFYLPLPRTLLKLIEYSIRTPSWTRIPSSRISIFFRPVTFFHDSLCSLSVFMFVSPCCFFPPANYESVCSVRETTFDSKQPFGNGYQNDLC